MTNTLAPPSPTVEREVTAIAPLPLDRDAMLHRLLGVDYCYAVESGLVGEFYYDPTTGEDGLIHTLAGDFKPGTTIPRGFHHPPSAAAVWPEEEFEQELPDGTTETGKRLVTRVEPSSHPRYPMEPSFDFVTVGGLQKVIPQKDKHGEIVGVARGKFGMFPSHYDPLAVMQAIKNAKNTRDTSADVIAEMRGSPRSVIKTKGKALLIDGKSFMTIKLVLDKDSGRVISAYPDTRGKPIMGLTEDQMWQYAWSQELN